MTQEEKRRAKAADRWLSRYREAEREAQTCRRQLVRLRGLARALPSPNLEATPVYTGRVSDPVEEAAVAIAACEAELGVRLRDALTVRREIAAVIRRVRPERDRQLLELRYIEGMSYLSTADALGICDASAAWHLTRRALAALDVGV